MFRLIKSVLSPLSGMRIEPNEKELEKKLHLITQHLINSHKQFDAWMELQTHNNLHATLSQVYASATQPTSPYTEEELCSIFQFYTLLLINCNDELLVCKLVSDEFVIGLCLMEGVDEERACQAEPYRINLIKAYLGTASHEAIKYMVIQDQFKVFLECVRLYQGKAGTVEQTTIANSILNVVKKADELAFLWESMWVPLGLMRLYEHCFERIREQLGSMEAEDLEETTLFMLEVGGAIKNAQYSERICEFCKDKFQQLLEHIRVADPNVSIRNISLLFGLFKQYGQERAIVEATLPWFEDILYQLLEHSQREEPVDEITLMVAFTVNKIITSPCSRLSERVLEEEEMAAVSKKRMEVMSILTLALKSNPRLIQKMKTEEIVPYLGYIRQLLRAVFYLKLALHPNDQNAELSIAVLEVFQAYTDIYKILLKKNEEWDSIIRWYDEGSLKVTKQILVAQDIFQHLKQNPMIGVLLSFEYIRTFRFMIAEMTTLDPKSIKQEKFHHSTFSSVGMAYQPNTVVDAGLLLPVAPCIVHHNYHQIPAIIVEDRECFIVAFKVSQEECKILINIKFTDIQNFVYGDSKGSEGRSNAQEPRYVKINLKGSQQLIFQFANPKIAGIKFKEYLIKSKDNARQRQLTFLNSWVKVYEADTLKSLQKLKQKQKADIVADPSEGL